MKNTKRILFIINDATLGGGQIHVEQLLKGINRIRFNPYLACNPLGALYPDYQKLSEACLPVSVNRGFSPLSVFRNVLSVVRIMRFIRQHRIDIVHTHGGIAGLWGRIAASLCNCTVIHTLHGIHYLHYRNPAAKMVYQVLERLLSRITDLVICVSESDRRAGLRFHLFSDSQSVVIYNGIQTRMPKPVNVRREFGLSAKSAIIVHVARLHYQKSQDVLLRAFSLVIQEIPAARLIVIGDGPLKTDLMSLTRKLRLESAVYFTGMRPDSREIAAGCDLFVLPSLWEGLPLAVLEAMMSSLPIVATNVDGISEMIQHDREGLLVPPKNDKLLAEAMIFLLRNRKKAKKLGQAAHQCVTNRFGLGRMLSETEKVYMNTGKSV